MTEHNIISVSGGKDSTALLLLAIERGAENLQAVFADTGHEHPQTYDYVRYLEQATGIPIRWVRADFTHRITRKRAFVAANWPEFFRAGRPAQEGTWMLREIPLVDLDAIPDAAGQPTEEVPPEPADRFRGGLRVGPWEWIPAVEAVPPMPEAEIAEVIARALATLQPTGNPFLDLCIWKGRFPSTKARFCSEELKKNPIVEQVQRPLMEAGADVISWQGVRADESPNRALLKEMDCNAQLPNGAELWNYRPILRWTVAEVFAMHDRHGIKPNPLYAQGMGRVGCMPCIHARKDELLEIARRFPAEIARVAEWERIVAMASKRGASSFFAIADGRGDNITEAVEWAKTSRGGKQFDLLRTGDRFELCSSIYGLCE